MSKAFTRESDDAPDMPHPVRTVPVLPSGTPNYLTLDGEARIRREIKELLLQRSEFENGTGESVRVHERLREIHEILQSAKVVAAPSPPWEQVSFGALVTVRDRNGNTDIYRIVGVPEVDLERGWISWQSPIAKALMNARVGEDVAIRLPGGVQELKVVDVTYISA